MADPKDDMMDEELRNTMGSYFNNVDRVPGESFQPGKSPAPKPPVPQGAKVEPQGGTGKGIRPPFDIIPNALVPTYEQEKQTDKDTFGSNQTQRFDPELNELALKEVAESRGMSVEEMLSSRADRMTDVKLAPASTPVDPLSPPPIVPPGIQIPKTADGSVPRSLITPEEEEMLRHSQDLVSQQAPEVSKKSAAELNADLLKQSKKRQARKEEKQKIEEKKGIPTEYNDNPVIAKLRKKLGLEAGKSAKVTVEGIDFELKTPPASMSLWILEKIDAGRVISGDGTPVTLTIKVATVSAAITKIEGTPIADVLGVVESDDELSRKIITAQTLWEMFIGLSSRKDLFSFHPELAVKLYEAYVAEFGKEELQSSLQDQIHRFVCGIPGCPEYYDMREPTSGVPPFCKVHGIPCADKGLVKELRSVPLA